MRGNLIIISSPSGGGKGTLIRNVLGRVPDLAYSVSLTTREPRPGEIDGESYRFVSRGEFERFAADDRFLEYAQVHGNLYGTSRDQIENFCRQGRDVILEIDVQGARQVLAKVPDAVSIFILPPSFEVLRDRLVKRATENPMNLSLRLRNAMSEVREYDRFRYTIINDNREEATARLERAILAERLRSNRQTEAIQDILVSFDLSKLENTGE